MTNVFDGVSRDVESITERTMEYVRDEMDTVGPRHLFRELDATNIDGDSIELDNTESTPEWRGFELTISRDGDDDELFEELNESVQWLTNSMLTRISNDIADEFDDVSIPTASSCIEAEKDLHRSDMVVSIPTMADGFIGELPAYCSATLDKRCLPVDKLLVADRTSLGFEVVKEELHTDVYESTDPETGETVDVVQIKTKVDYAINDEDAARWVPLD